MFFFQTLLVAGYAYAHGIASRLNTRAQKVVHAILLGFCVLLLGAMAFVWRSALTPDISWRPHDSAHPTWRLIVLLSISAGLPYFTLSSTGPLLQSWFTRTHPGRSPYRLYALSNAGSLLALISYPFVIEPLLTLRWQARYWCWGFLIFALLCGYRALKLPSIAINADDSETARSPIDERHRPSIGDHILWLALAACASIMFLATTNQICQDVAVVPLLWVLPLSLYLLSFIISFDQSRWYSRAVFHLAFGIIVFLACLVLNGWGYRNIRLQIAVYSLTLFVCCMVCHGELARAKPAARYLTSFYLMVSLGGAIGGVFVALIAPRLFHAFWEYQIGLFASATLLFLILARDRTSWLHSKQFGLPILAVAAGLLPGVTTFAKESARGAENLVPAIPLLIAVCVLAFWGKKGENPARHRAVPIFCGAALLVLGGTLFSMAVNWMRGIEWSSRNFYGVLTVRGVDITDPDLQAYMLQHGRIAHGYQFRGPNKRSTPTGYYAAASGAGRALIGLRSVREKRGNSSGLRVGIVGLGAGTLAAYGRPGDYFRFYEINPEVVRIANDRRYFTYLMDCPARHDVIVGDARISMERELEQKQSQHFDLLVLDAFSGDAIPVHLLTEEAFRIYLQQIQQPRGILAVHITNGFLDLSPVLARVAQRFRLNYTLLHTSGDNLVSSYSDWVLLSYDNQLVSSLLRPDELNSSGPPISQVSLWTDDYSNLFQVLRK